MSGSRFSALRSIDPAFTPLPRGTEVTTRVARVLPDRLLPMGAVGRVSHGDHQRVFVDIVGVGMLEFGREEVALRKAGQARYATRRYDAWSALSTTIVLRTPRAVDGHQAVKGFAHGGVGRGRSAAAWSRRGPPLDQAPATSRRRTRRAALAQGQDGGGSAVGARPPGAVGAERPASTRSRVGQYQVNSSNGSEQLSAAERVVVGRVLEERREHLVA